MLIGVVGKPNVGKSTFFQAMTSAPVPRANYPFTTIDPNKGVGHVRIRCVDVEFGVQCNPRYGFCEKGWRFIPVELVDVAGLVPGAHEGRGLGNKFLDDLRKADVLIHVIDASGSTNADGEPVTPGSYDPINDVLFLEEELDHWIFGILNKNWDRLARLEKTTNKKRDEMLADQLSGLGVDKPRVQDAIREMKLEETPLIEWNEETRFKFARRIRELTKPILIAANKCDMPTAEENIKRLKERFPDYIIIPTSAESELALKEAAKKGYIKYIPGENNFEIIGNLDDKQKKALEFIRKKVLARFGSTGVQQCLDKAVFELLGYIAVYPGGVNKLADSEGRILPDVFLMPPESTALDFAARIHQDMAKHFIRAIDVKTKRTLGADYKLKHKDVIEIVFGR